MIFLGANKHGWMDGWIESAQYVVHAFVINTVQCTLCAL